MGKAGKRAAPTPAASKPAVQPKRQRKAGSNKDELPILSEDEKKEVQEPVGKLPWVMCFY